MPGNEQDEQAVLAADAERRRALVANDIAALEVVHDPALTFTHSSGRTDMGLPAFLSRLKSGEMRFTRADVEECRARSFGDAAWITGKVRYAFEFSDGRKTESYNRFLSVWVREGRKWKMAAWQANKLAAAS
jgi:ketosteroid isomerase-like protein